MSDDEPAAPDLGPPPTPAGWVPPAPAAPHGAWVPPNPGDPQPFAASYITPSGFAYGPGSAQPTYQPGLGKVSTLPPTATGWNWGAFFFTWIWGLFNGAYVTLWGLLLSIVPFGNIVWAIVCGVNGSRWAWQGKPWASVEHFRSVQHRWAVAALVVFLVAVLALVLIAVALLARANTSGVGVGGAAPALSF